MTFKGLSGSVFTLIAIIVFFSVNGMLTSCDDDVATMDESLITFRFSHNFDGAMVDSSTFNQFNYINAHGDTLSISRLRYLVSNIELTASNGDKYVIDDHQLVDVKAGTGFTMEVDGEIPQGTYTELSFTFGFDEEDNIDGGYPDLNIATWNWPEMLGGGYHFMQMEGMFKDQGVDKPYAYHNGTARVSTGVFEQNFFETDLAGFTLNKAFVEIEIEMDISEWYKNPNTWDLSVLNMMLMPNYDAQKMMQANGASVFSLGSVIQND